MIDINRYIVNGAVKRDKIVADIKRGILSKNDIKDLDRNSLVKDAYFGEGFSEKRVKEEWNDRYLDELSLVSVSEKFNKEYLLFLCEVSEYIREDNEKKEQDRKIAAIIAGGIICLIIISFFIALAAFKVKKDNVAISINSIALTKNIHLCIVKKIR